MTSHESVSDPHAVLTRGHGWGDDAARQAMSEVADNLRHLAGYEVCGIEVLRSDDALEIVGLATDDPHTRKAYDGASSPLSAMYPMLDLGTRTGLLTFIRAEEMTPEAFEQIRPYAITPDIAPTDDVTRWHADDMLVAQVVNDQDQLRSLVYFDVPRDGLRPTAAEIVDLDRTIRPILRGLLFQIEHEEFVQRIRLTNGARAVIRATPPHADIRELFRVVRSKGREPFRAKALWINTLDEFDTLEVAYANAHADAPGPEAGPDLRAALSAALHRAWDRQAVLIVDHDHVWGDEDLDTHYRDELTPHLVARELSEMVLVPVGAGPDLLGLLAVDRDPGAPRWTDDESAAALDVAHDLGRAILNARASARERAAVAELRELDAYRRSLIDNVARELQNPLALVAGHLELLEVMELPEDARSSVAPMLRNTARLTALAQDLALLSRVADSTRPIGTATLDLAELTREAIESVSAQAQHREVSIALVVTGSCAVQGHPLELSRGIGGLLDNAVKFSARGGKVEVEVRGGDAHVTLSVRDHGIGISSTDQRMLFGEFFRSADPASMDRSGFGLGLSIVRQVVIRHGGTIDVESERGEGARFIVVLPAADTETLATTW